jgi:general secretion pathway protein N
MFAASSSSQDIDRIDTIDTAVSPGVSANPDPSPAQFPSLSASRPGASAAPETQRAPSANPLWAIPLNRLSATRDRPIFSPSRRRPPPAVAAEPKLSVPNAAPPRGPARPPLSLVGTIASDEEGFGIFLDESTRVPLRLKIGEDYQGWKLRSVRGREATLENDRQTVVMSLPQPGEMQRPPSGEADASSTGRIRQR